MTGKKEKVQMSAMAKREERWGWLFIAAPFVGFLCFMAYPIVFAVIVSMSRWTGINSLWGNLVGFRNYIEIFQDAKFWKSMLNTIIYMIGIPIGLLVSYGISDVRRTLPNTERQTISCCGASVSA